MSLFFAPVANVILGSVRREEEGQASGANNAIRELGGVFGVAVLAAIFAAYGSYDTPQAYADGIEPAVWIGAVVVGLGALAALGLPRRRRAQQQEREQSSRRARPGAGGVNVARPSGIGVGPQGRELPKRGKQNVADFRL